MSKLYYYFDVSLEFYNQTDILVTAELFRFHIEKALTQLFGEIGGATEIDLLKYDCIARRGIIRVYRNSYVKLRSSFTLYSQLQEGNTCRFHIHKTSPVLLNLLGDSRSTQW